MALSSPLPAPAAASGASASERDGPLLRRNVPAAEGCSIVGEGVPQAPVPVVGEVVEGATVEEPRVWTEEGKEGSRRRLVWLRNEGRCMVDFWGGVYRGLLRRWEGREGWRGKELRSWELQAKEKCRAGEFGARTGARGVGKRELEVLGRSRSGGGK